VAGELRKQHQDAEVGYDVSRAYAEGAGGAKLRVREEDGARDDQGDRGCTDGLEPWLGVKPFAVDGQETSESNRGAGVLELVLDAPQVSWTLHHRVVAKAGRDEDESGGDVAADSNRD
jgi:hypothetical protein